MTHSDIHKSLVHKEYLYSAKNQQSLDAELSNGLFHLLTQSFAETKRLNFGLSQELRLTSHLRTSSLTSSEIPITQPPTLRGPRVGASVTTED